MADEDLIIGVGTEGVDDAVRDLGKVAQAQQRIGQAGASQATAATQQARAVQQSSGQQVTALNTLGSKWGQVGGAIGQVGSALGHVNPAFGQLGSVIGAAGGAMGGLTGALGPLGVGLGIATTAITLFAGGLGDTVTEAQQAKDDIEALTASIDRFNQRRRLFAGQASEEDTAEALGAVTDRIQGRMAEMTGLRREAANLRQQLRRLDADLASGGGLTGTRGLGQGAGGAGLREERARVAEELSQAEQRIHAIRGSLSSARREQAALLRAENTATGRESTERGARTASDEARTNRRSGASAARAAAREREQRLERMLSEASRRAAEDFAIAERRINEIADAREAQLREQSGIRGEGSRLEEELEEYRRFVSEQGVLDAARSEAFAGHLRQREDDFAAHQAAMRDMETAGTDWTAEEFQARLALHRDMLAARRDAERAAAQQAEREGTERARLQREETEKHNKLMGDVVSMSLAPVTDAAGKMFTFLAEGAEGGSDAFVALLDNFLETTAIQYTIKALAELAEMAAAAARQDWGAFAQHGVAAGMAAAVAAATGGAGAAIQAPAAPAGGAGASSRPVTPQQPPQGATEPFVVNIYASGAVFTERERTQMIAAGIRETRRNGSRRVRT